MDVWYLFHYHSFNCIQGQNLICIFLEQFWPFFRARQWKFEMTFWVLPQLLSVALSQNYTFFNASIVKDSTKNHSIANRLERCQHLYAMTEYILGSSSLNFPKSPQANNIIHSIPFHPKWAWCFPLKLKPIGMLSVQKRCRRNAFIMLEGWRISKRTKKTPLAFFLEINVLLEMWKICVSRINRNGFSANEFNFMQMKLANFHCHIRFHQLSQKLIAYK